MKMRLREIVTTRKKLGLTQIRLSKLIKKSETFMCKLEHGDRKLTPEIKNSILGAFTKHRKMKAKR
jgi:predicted transcriptional regulator